MKFATKAEWAAAQAKQLRDRAAALRYQSSGGSTSRARRKFSGVETINAEAARFESIAASFKRQGK